MKIVYLFSRTSRRSLCNKTQTIKCCPINSIACEVVMFVVSQGLEPCQTEPKPVVLPLHHETGVKNITHLRRQVMYGKNTNLFL